MTPLLLFKALFDFWGLYFRFCSTFEDYFMHFILRHTVTMLLFWLQLLAIFYSDICASAR